MKPSKPFIFLFQVVTVALAAFIVVVVVKPGLLQQRPAVVEIQHSGPATTPTASQPGSGPVSYAAAVGRAGPAVVNIHTAKVVRRNPDPLLDDPLLRRFFGSGGNSTRPRRETSLGSGVIFSAQGYVLTNNHVIQGADEIQVALANGNTRPATLVGADPETDLAVLKIDAAELPSISIADSDKLKVGDVVLAIGNPFGLGQTVTQGIVSATGRNQLGINTFENFIQTDAAINPGNSGGALINAHGELIGINTAIFSRSGGSQGLGFAIPSKIAGNVLRQIIEHGRVVRGWLGIQAGDTSLRTHGGGMARGVLVAGVLRNGPADEAGLRPGDVITHINGETVSDSAQVLNRIAWIRPGEQVEITVNRENETLTLKATVAQRPSFAA